jgi:hypothetical protein
MPGKKIRRTGIRGVIFAMVVAPPLISSSGKRK